MNRELEIRERVALYRLELTGHDREALDIARGNLEFYAYSDLRYLLSETARLRAELDVTRNMCDGAKAMLFKFLDTGMKPDEIERMKAELDAAQRRAEAAERDLGFACGSQPSASDDCSICDVCAHMRADGSCPKQCFMNSLGAMNRWEWRGPDAPSKEVQP